MYAESRKIQLIEELLKTDDDAVLTAIETVFKQTTLSKTKKPSIYDFLGVMSKKDAMKMKTAIEETSEIIHADDWK